jgi:hypothetical protein
VPSWLLLDLRGNRCIAGLIHLASQSSPSWQPCMLDVYVTASDRDSRKSADLAFFRKTGKGPWRPALRTVLDDPVLADDIGTGRIAALLHEPADRLRELLPMTLGTLVRSCLREYLGVPVLAVLDRAEALAPVRNYFASFTPPGEAVVVTASGPGLEGFALWDPSEPTFPAKDRKWECSVVLNAGQPGGTSGGLPGTRKEYRRYIWKGTRFAVRTLAAPPSEFCGPVWRLAELASVGAAMYGTVWREQLRAARTDIRKLEDRTKVGERLLLRLSEICSDFPGELGSLFARAASRRPE